MTSMINLLSLLKEESDLDIDVLLMDPFGPLYQECQKQANVIGTDAYLLAVTLSRKELKQKGKYKQLQQHCSWALVFTLSPDINGKYKITSYKRIDEIKSI